MLVTALGIVAAVVPSARAWPQFVRIVVRNDSSGVSLLAWTLVLANFTVWSVYGVLVDLPVLIVANIAAGLGAAAVLVGLARRGVGSMIRPLAVIAGLTGFSFLIDALLGDSFIWVGATTLAICMFLPQVYTIFRTNPSGVSPATWWLGIFAGGIWATYGVLVGEPQIAAPHIVMVPSAVAILWRIYTYSETDEKPGHLAPVGN